MGKLAHDNKAQGSVDTVNDAVVLLKFMFLSGEICLSCGANCLVSPGRTPGLTSPIRPVCYRLSGAKNRIAAKQFCIAACEVTRLLKLSRSQQKP